MDGIENGLFFLTWINQQLLLSIQNVGEYCRTYQNYFQCYSKPKNPTGVIFQERLRECFLELPFTDIAKFVSMGKHFRINMDACVSDKARWFK